MIGPFLTKLVENSDLLAEYGDDPDGVMEREGLTEDEREIVRSGDLKRLRDALQEENPGKEIFLGNAPVSAPPPRPPRPPEGDDNGES